MKKLFALLLTGVLTFSLCIPAFCSEEVVALKKGSYVVSKGREEAETEIEKEFLLVTDLDEDGGFSFRKGHRFRVPHDGQYKIRGQYTIEMGPRQTTN